MYMYPEMIVLLSDYLFVNDLMKEINSCMHLFIHFICKKVHFKSECAYLYVHIPEHYKLPLLEPELVSLYAKILVSVSLNILSLRFS